MKQYFFSLVAVVVVSLYFALTIGIYWYIVTVSCVQTQIKHLSSAYMPWQWFTTMTSLKKDKICTKCVSQTFFWDWTTKTSARMRWKNKLSKYEKKKQSTTESIMSWWHINKNAYQLLSASNKFAINICYRSSSDSKCLAPLLMRYCSFRCFFIVALCLLMPRSVLKYG